MGITPLALLLDELKLLDEPTDELLDEMTLEETRLDDVLLLDGRRLLDDDRTLEELDELLRIELELTDELETPQPLINPKGDGWLMQVVCEIQLLPFS